MLDNEPPKKIRKGAKSCTECRRRKIRCVWLSDDARVCRRCEERGSACVPQVFSSQTTRPGALGSRSRISRLERQITDLTGVINSIQEKLGGAPIAVEPLAEHDDASSTSYDDSDAGDQLQPEAPPYLKSLFDNNVISTGDPVNGTENRRETMSTMLATRARNILRTLVPPKQEVISVAPFAKAWIMIYQAMFPSRSIPSSEAELIAMYDEMQKPDIPPTALATWLVSVAITSQQATEEHVKTLVTLRNPSQYCKTVSDVIEKHLILHDSLIGTMDGISMTLHYLRLQASRASFRRLWLTLRRIIAIAELIGLPRTALNYYSMQNRSSTVAHRLTHNDLQTREAREAKAEAWVSICTLDRILGMMCNLPPGTTRYALPKPSIDFDQPIQFVRAYLRDLADIASKVQDLDDLRMSGGSDDDVCAEVLRIDRELMALANTTPRDWWDDDRPIRLPESFMPYWQAYITLRTHLVLTLQKDENHQYDYSRFTCMKSCQTALSKFLKIRPMLPGGFFLGRLLNLQALTASVVLLLSWHTSKTDIGFHFQAQTIGPPKALIEEVVVTMENMSNHKAVDYGKQAASTIKSLITLLKDDGNSHAKDLTVRVPLLGKIHVQRNETEQQIHQHQQQRQRSAGRNSINGSSSSRFQLSNDQPMPPLPFTGSAQPTSMSSMPAQSIENHAAVDGWHFDPFTWAIEDDHESTFKDTLSIEDFNFFDSAGGYTNLQF